MTLPPPKPLIGDIWRIDYTLTDVWRGPSAQAYDIVRVRRFVDRGRFIGDAVCQIIESTRNKDEEESDPLIWFSVKTLQSGHLLIRNGQIYRGVQDADSRSHISKNDPEVES